MSETRKVTISLPDDLLDQIDDKTNNRSAYFRELAQWDLDTEGRVSRGMAKRKIKSLERQKAAKEAEMEAIEGDIEDYRQMVETSEATQEAALEDVLEKLEKTPRDPTNTAIINRAEEVGITPQELVDELEDYYGDDGDDDDPVLMADGGRDINHEYVDAFEEFFRRYCDEDIKEFAQHYPKERQSFVFDWRDLFQYDRKFAESLFENYDTLIASAEMALEWYDLPIDVDLSSASVRVSNLPEEHTHAVGEFSPSRMQDRLMAVSGQVAKVTEVKPRAEHLSFVCKECGTPNEVEQSGNGIDLPNKCDGCGTNGPFDAHEHSTVDYQVVRLETPPEQVDGTAGQTVDVRVEDDLVRCVDPGDRVDFVGHFRHEIPDKKNATTLDTYLEGEHADVQQTDFEEIDITPDMVDRFEEIASGRYGDPHDVIQGSLAPSLSGLEEVKEGLILALFGGVGVDKHDGTRDRGDIHVLMIGDPGVGKSTLLEAIKELSPRAVGASGRGASKSGMTAAAVKDDFGDGEQWTLDAGALVVANKGVACIDEIDKLSDGVEESMHSAMSDQYVSVNKAGINATLPAKTTVIAAGNPEHGRFHDDAPKGSQIDIGNTIQSRFDLIYALEDERTTDGDFEFMKSKIRTKEANKCGEAGDDELAIQRAVERDEDALEFLRAYIAHAKRSIEPRLDPDSEAARLLADAYETIRSMNGGEGKPSAGKRDADGLYRLAEASARVRLSETISAEDVERAKRLVKQTLEETLKDPVTEDWDPDYRDSSVDPGQRNRIRAIQWRVENRNLESEGQLIESMVDDGFSRKPVEKDVRNLFDKGDILDYTPLEWNGNTTEQW